MSVIEDNYIFPVADGFETALRVEIWSDTPQKVWDARSKLGKLLLDADAGDVMVTVHIERKPILERTDP